MSLAVTGAADRALILPQSPVHGWRRPTPAGLRRVGVQAASADSLGAQEVSAQSITSSISEAATPVSPDTNGAESSLDEYTAMKKQLLGRAKTAAGFLTAYITLQQGLVAGACTLAGGVTGFVYLTRIIHEADSVKADSVVPMMAAQEIDSGAARQISMIFAGYRQAVRPRWLLPICLAATVQAFNNAHLDLQITNLQEFDILLGFLCYKAGLFLALYDDVKPKFDASKLDVPARPIVSDAALSREEANEREALLRSRKRH